MNKDINYDDVSILVVGYDGYIDVWNHFVELINKNWPNRPKTYLATSELTPVYPNIKVIPAGAGSEWSTRASCALKQINTPYVILLLEDFFISEPVDNIQVRKTLDLIKKDNIKFYQLLVQLLVQTWEKGKPYKGNKKILIVPSDKKYPLNLQAAIWEKNFLEKTIGSGNYNAWKFEINQLGYKCNEGKIDCLIDVTNMLNIIHSIVQSKYLRGAITQLRKQGYTIDTRERNTLSKLDDLKYLFKLLMYSLTPKCLEKYFKAIGKLLQIDFVTDRLNKNE